MTSQTAASNAPGLNILPVRGNNETIGDAERNTWMAAFEPGLTARHVTYFGNHDGYDLVRLDHLPNTYGYLRVTVNDCPKPGEKTIRVNFVPLTL